MRRRPDDEEEGYQVTDAAFVGAKRTDASQSAHGVLPFLAAGGMSYWFAEDTGYDPFSTGVQLVAHVYVPKGRQGFLKELRIAPYCPAALCDPWTSSGVSNGSQAPSWRTWNRNASNFPDGILPVMGDLWRMPLGWEAAWDEFSGDVPSWRWSLRFLQGNVDILRGQGFLNIPPFDEFNPQSWYLVPSIPVPGAAYPSGLPGWSVGPAWDAQRLQILPTDKASLHVPIPQDTTVLLFAQWSQSTVAPAAQVGSLRQTYGDRVYPIGPSVGSLLGYSQALTSKPARHNLEHGWGG